MLFEVENEVLLSNKHKKCEATVELYISYLFQKIISQTQDILCDLLFSF